jgi:hypothetical protein
MSIRENELRVGVYILYCEKVFQVDAECINMHWGDDLDDAYRPIPITEEWLLKFGFDKIGKTYYKNDFRYEFGNINRAILGKEDSCMLLVTHIENVHQLQNLYFGLTNKEL